MSTTTKVTAAEIERARKRGVLHDRIEPLAKAAHFDIETNELFIQLKGGGSFSVPKRRLPKLIAAKKGTKLEAVSVMTPGTGVWFNTIDEGLQISKLVELAFGADFIRYYAAMLAGSTTSERKASAARANGAAGGRPRQNPTFYDEIGKKGINGVRRKGPASLRKALHDHK